MRIQMASEWMKTVDEVVEFYRVNRVCQATTEWTMKRIAPDLLSSTGYLLISSTPAGATRMTT